MLLSVVLFPIILCCSLFVSTIGAVIHKSSDAARNLDQYGCLTLSDGARLGFQNKEDIYMRNKVVALGERVELRCQVIGAPQATIRWKHNGIFLDQEQAGDYQAMIDNGEMPVIGIGATVSTLVIDCVDRKTAGHYTCVAENRCSEAIDTSVIVAIIEADADEQFVCPKQAISAGVPPKIIFLTDSVIERPEATVTLFCRATGYPRPAIIWFEEEETTNEYHSVKNDERHLLLANGDLLIRGRSRTGKQAPSTGYKCVARNEHGSDAMETVIVHANL